MLERFFTFLRTVGQAALCVQERRAQIRTDIYASPWELLTGEVPALKNQ